MSGEYYKVKDFFEKLDAETLKKIVICELWFKESDEFGMRIYNEYIKNGRYKEYGVILNE